MPIKQQILTELQEASALLNIFINEPKNISLIEDAVNLMVAALKDQKKIISCGNGGSMSDAMHFAEELTGRYRDDRQPWPAIAISDPAYITCTANDYGFDSVFSRYIDGVGVSGDILLAISTSGNSANVLKAVQCARKKQMKIIALTGKNGGQLSEMADIEIRAPYSKYSDRAQEIHIKIIHLLVQGIEHSM